MAKKDKLESASKIETANCADAQGKAAAASPKAFARVGKNESRHVGRWNCVVALVVGLVACAPSATTGKIEAAPSPNAAAKHATPEADEVRRGNRRIVEDIYPNEYASYMDNASNSPDSGKKNYLETYPALNTMYKRDTRSRWADQAAGHLYTLEA